jgi:quinohemoprotein amine dehydrogenase beta subunit
MSFATIGRAWAACAALALCAGAASRADAGDLIVTGAKPDHLFVIDAASRTVRSDLRIPGANGIVGAVIISPDHKTVYVLVDRMERIVGLDIASGREVFRAVLSTPDERVKSFFSMVLTPDGKELIVHEMPTKLLPNEYVAEDTRFAVYRTNAGLEAKAVRTFPAPRRVHMLLMRPSGRSFYAVGFNLDEFDVKTGKLLGTRGIQQWNLPEHGQPDLLAFWPVTEPTGVWTSPVYSDLKKGGETVPTTALMSLDLKSGELSYEDFEPFSALIFATVLSPDRKHAYGVYTTLTSIDVPGHRLEKRVPLDHTFYDVNLSTDGSEIYTGGTQCDVGIYDAATLAKKAVVKLPGCPDQSISTLRVFHEK